jgi:ribonuclease T1
MKQALSFRVGAILVALMLLAPAAEARNDAGVALPAVAASALPREARETLAAIRHGGPFAFDRDGVVFGNREHLLPAKPRGYYHEYTVKSPSVKSRGARRIVCGGEVTQLTECYYSDDHYQSFKIIRP